MLRQFHLKLTFAGAGPGAEDIQNKAGAVDDLALPGALQVALLHRAERAIDNHDGGMMFANDLTNLHHFSGAEQGCRADARYRYDGAISDLQPDGTGETDGFFQPCLAVTRRNDVVCCRPPAIGGAVAPLLRRQFRMNDASYGRRSVNS